jgi:hypothetical protein
MNPPGGGRVAAYGLNYQYLATAEFFLGFLRKNIDLLPRAVLVIEPSGAKADSKNDDIVDLAIEIDGEATHHIQVKASTKPDEHPLPPAEAREVLIRLLSHSPDHSLLLTNKPLSPQLTLESSVYSADGPISTYTWPQGPRAPGDSINPLITVDTRSPAQLRGSIAELVRHFRKRRSLGQGLTSVRLLVAILLDFIFDAAAGIEHSRVSALDLVEKIQMPDPRMAHLAGGFDWGLPMSGIPNYASTVPRMAILDELLEHLTTDDTESVPARVVLAGHTGIGKSVIASDYCHIDRISYEFLCWIDCRDTGLIEPRIRDIVSQLTKDVVPPAADVAPVFTGILGRHSGPWLLVFDGIQNASDIERFVPTVGRGSVLITTNNSLGWWHDAHQLEVGVLTPDEAVDCFASYAGVPERAVDNVREPIAEIVERLGRIPLAVSMGGLYFRNAEGQLNELALQYFSDLASLDDSYAIPPGFDRTAHAAVRYAVDNLGKGTKTGDQYRRRAKALLYVGSLLAPELLPLNLLLPASADVLDMDLSALPRPAEADSTLRRGVIATLRTQTVAHRVVNADLGNITPASDTVAVHPVVHEILQRSYLAEVPPGRLQGIAEGLMYFLVGWIGSLRTDGQFFAVEQLRMHAEALLDLVNEREPLSASSADQDLFYKYIKAMLQVELSTCHFSRGNLQRAYDLGTAAAQALSILADQPVARMIVMKSVFNQIHDLSFAEAPAPLLAIHAHVLLRFCLEYEGSQLESIRDLAYTSAGEALLMVTRTGDYRNSQPLQAVAAQLADIGTRDPAPETRSHTRNKRINELYEAGEFEQILQDLPKWRALDPGVHTAIFYDGLQVVAQLRTRKFDDALAGISALLDLKPYGQHLLLFAHEALKKIGKALYQTIPAAGRDASRLQAALDQVLAKYYQLTGTANQGPS